MGGEYQYDLADRLTQWSPRHPTMPIGTIYPRQYRWDNNGNARLSRTVNIFEQQWSYDARNRVTATSMDWDGDYYLYPVENSPAGQVTYLGDANRNLTYDALGQLIGDKATTYKYDGLGRLAERTTGTATQQFAYAGASSQPYRAPASTTAFENVGRASNGTILTSSFGPRIALSDAHGDILGGIATAGAASGTLVSSVGYEPFGEIWSGSATPSQQRSAFGFQGSWTDSQTGSVWMGTRWYDPSLGSFLSRDDTRFDFTGAHALNLYAYGNGNPVKYIDPDGRSPIPVLLAFFADYGAFIFLAGASAAVLADIQSGHELSYAIGHGLEQGAISAANSVASLWNQIAATFDVEFVPGECYVYAACNPFGPPRVPPFNPPLDDPPPATTSPPPFRPDTTIDLSRAENELKTIADSTIGAVTSFVAASVAADACGIAGTIQSCISPDRTVPSACAGPASAAGLCTPSRPVPGGGGGSGPTLPVKPLTDGSITNSAGLAVAVGIAFAIGAPQGPTDPDEECLPDPEGSEDGIVYERLDSSENPLKPYRGQAKSDLRYSARQAEHSRDYPDSDFSFTIIDRAEPGLALDLAEQRAIDAGGGPTNVGNPEGQLSNRRNQVSEKRFKDLWDGC